MDRASLLSQLKVLSNQTGTSLSAKCKQAAAPLMGLKPLEFMEAQVRTKQLGQEICFEGRVVEANICSAHRIDKRHVLCMVEAEDSQNSGGGGLLHIFNALKSTSREDEAEAMFPRDVKVAIKEPLCFCSLMQVSSPASVELVGLKRTLKRRPVKELVEQGKRLLHKGSYQLAELYFTECINLFTMRDKSTYGGMEKEVFSGRAEARLKLGRYEEAILDADQALEICSGDSFHVKSLRTKGKGLTALQEHELALKCFTSAAEMEQPASSKELIQSDMEKSEVFLRQSRKGEYDISHYLLDQTETGTEYSDFFGPVELRLTPDGRGRGMFVTRDVRLGELLLASNATAAAKASGPKDANEDLNVDLVKACISSDRRLRQVYAMADAEEMEAVSDTTPFKCNVGKVVQRPWNRVVDMGRIRRVRYRVHYTYGENGSGLWAAPALLNHSCLPTASKGGINRMMFVRAARDLRAGEEVVVSYYGTCLAPLRYREMKIKDYDFECKCRRCEFERRNRQLLDSLPFKDPGDSKSVNVDENVMALVLDIEKRIRNFGEEEKNWVRAGFPDAYLAVCLLKNPRIPSLEKVLNIFREIAPGNFYTLSRIALLCTLSRNDPLAVKFLREEVYAQFGLQSDEVVEAVTKDYRLPGLGKL